MATNRQLLDRFERFIALCHNHFATDFLKAFSFAQSKISIWNYCAETCLKLLNNKKRYLNLVLVFSCFPTHIKIVFNLQTKKQILDSAVNPVFLSASSLNRNLPAWWTEEDSSKQTNKNEANKWPRDTRVACAWILKF